MVGENKRDPRVVPTGVDEGLPPITVADDHLEKMNTLGGAEEERKQASAEVVKVSDKDRATQKKPRFIWTRDVHKCFLDAIDKIGFPRAVPTKILELMNMEDLTRENVASHLQKFRLQVRRKEQERAGARAASENVPKGVYPHMSGIPQQPCALPNTMQDINMDCACLDGSQLAPSFANHNLNMNQAGYGAPFKDLFNESVNRMSSFRLMHDLYDSNGPHDINKIGYNYGQLPPKPSVGSYAHNLMDRHDTTLVPQYDRRDDWSLQGIISPFVPQYDRRDELSLPSIISPSFVSQYDRRDELSLQGIISPSFVPQYDQRDELPVADQGIISPLLAQNMAGLGVGVTRPPEAIGGLIGMKVEGIEVRMPRPPTGVLVTKIKRFGPGVPCLPESNRIKVDRHGVGMTRPPTGGLVGMKDEGLGLGVPRMPETTGCLTGMKVKGHGLCLPRLPEATGGLAGKKDEGFGQGVSRLPEATEGLAGMKVRGHGLGVPHLPEGAGGLAGMKVEGHVPRLSEATGSLAVEGHGAGVTHLPEATGGPGLGVPWPPKASGGLTGMNDVQPGFPFVDDVDFNDFGMNKKGDVDISFDDLFWR